MKRPQSYMRELRKARVPPLTLKQLASKSDVSYATLWNLENGRGQYVSFAIHLKVAEALGIDPIKIFPSAMNQSRQALIYFASLPNETQQELVKRLKEEIRDPLK